LGLRNLNDIERALTKYDIDCAYERTGNIEVANTNNPPSFFEEIREDYELMRQFGHEVEWLDAEQMQAEIHSPIFTGGVWDKNGCAMVDPARLVWGLKGVAESLGVRIYEDTKATDLKRDGVGVMVTTPLGAIRAGKVALATNAFKPLLRRLGNYIAPVYDYCMVTEPLTADQMDAIGWKRRQGLGDVGNQFHYFRLTADNRILWGGYDAVYYWGGKVNAELETRPESWARLSQHFFETFPQLAEVRFTHVWGGAIDTCSRFSVFWGRAMNGRVAYALGYTGLGVGASRFGAGVMLDLLHGRRSIATQTQFVQSKPVPFPPEPFRFAGIQATRWSLDREDKTGKRNLWLKSLDRMGLGFDS
jgi:glycine/D-amino acid oxidase-like deaminating enzyme